MYDPNGKKVIYLNQIDVVERILGQVFRQLWFQRVTSKLVTGTIQANFAEI